MAQLSPEEDPHTFAEEGLPCRHVVMVCYSYCKPAGSRRWRRGKGGWGSKTTPAAAAADTSVLVPGRGGGGGGGDDNDVVAPSRIPDLEFNGGGRSDGGPPRGTDWGWGYYPCWAFRKGRLGGVLHGGTQRVPGPSPIPG